MSLESRIREAVGVAKVLKTLKETYHIKAPAVIEGGDVLRVEGRVFVGLSTRTNLHAVDQLGEILEDSSLEVVPVKVHNVLHLKSACTYLGDNYVILSRGHFDTSIMRHINKIMVPEGEEYAADCLSINGTILMAKGYPKTKKLLEKEGFSIKELDVSEFRKGDGALTCLSITWRLFPTRLTTDIHAYARAIMDWHAVVLGDDLSCRYEVC